MSNDELENTSKIETLEDIFKETEEEIIREEEPKENNINNSKKRFKKVRNWWSNFSKNQKIALIVIAILLLLVIVLGIFALLNKHEEEKPVLESPVEDVIVEQENYRYLNGKLVFLNDKDEEIGTYECENAREDLCFVSYYSTEDNFDEAKKVYEDETLVVERTSIINDRFVFINDNKENNDSIKIYDIKENKIVEENYRLVKKADLEGKSFILKNNTSNYGVITFTEEGLAKTISFTYDYLGFASKTPDRFISIQNKRNIVVNASGKNLSKNISGEVKDLNEKYIKTINENNRYSIYDYNGKEIFADYDYIELYSEYVALVNNDKVELKFYDGSKIHEKEINLYNKNYVKVNVYDENKKLKETKESFYINENGNTINVEVIKDNNIRTTSLNKLEALVSKNTKYINYFDGKLYIYHDIEKTNLIGTYNCNNKNNLNEETTELVNCFVAKDTVFENNDIEAAGINSIIPIFNERYIFLNDNPDLVNDSNKTIVLYDMQKNNTISKYNAVNTYSYTGLNEISFKSISNLQVVAKNKSEKFGVIKLESDSVIAHIPFKYTALEKIGEYYSADDGNGNILLSINNTTPLFQNPIVGKIRNYNDDYVTVLKDNLYYVFSHDGNKINENGYTYIALYSNFFAAVDENNKLSLHLYDNPLENFLEPEVKLNLNNYYGKGMVAFKINVSGLSYTIEVGTNANTYEIAATGTIPREETGEE